jgi:hypothetical protein
MNSPQLRPATGLQVDVRYFGHRYVADVLRVTARAVTFSFNTKGRAKKGAARLVRRVAINPSRQQRDRGAAPVVLAGLASKDQLTREQTAFGSWAELTDAVKHGYSPTLLGDGLQAILANTYDLHMFVVGRPNRAHRRARVEESSLHRAARERAEARHAEAEDRAAFQLCVYEAQRSNRA